MNYNIANRNSISTKNPLLFLSQIFFVHVYAEFAKSTDQKPYPFNKTQPPTRDDFLPLPVDISLSLSLCPIRRESDCRKCGLKKALSRCVSLSLSLSVPLYQKEEGRKEVAQCTTTTAPPPSYRLRSTVSIGEYDACDNARGQISKHKCQIVQTMKM